MSDITFGWDLTYNNCLNEITRKEDVLLVFIHWFLTKKGFRCIGLGSEKEFDSEDAGSEILTPGWSSMGDDISIRYVMNKKLYVLRGVRSEEQSLFNLLRVEDYAVSSLVVVVETTIMTTRGTLVEMIPTYVSLMDKLRRNLIAPVHVGHQREISVQTEASPSRGVLNPTSPQSPLGGAIRPGLGVDHHRWDPYGVGRSDLYPEIGGIGGIGGGSGMLFNPFRTPPGGSDPGQGVPGGLPRGAVPPGARFDPFGPPSINRGRGPGRGSRFGEPGPDHLAPPGYDDMFM